MVNPEELVIMSCDMEVRLRKFESIRKARNPKKNRNHMESKLELPVIKFVLWFNAVEDFKLFSCTVSIIISGLFSGRGPVDIRLAKLRDQFLCHVSKIGIFIKVVRAANIGRGRRQQGHFET
ncbi:hypothetical protein M9H77_35628 [Catharanthus roseus]|uniref:Uncharacterized protein n=1 Tax=Catharanthus roseus TaxID=4058 RepID=A0ACB9ZPV3_CATRO|nr:hypothetical protein M9H77_35628 [Catharanthus roseus]